MVDEKVVDVLKEQLPAYFRPIIEFQEIMKAHGYSLEELKKIFIHMWENFYLISCDGQTLAYYEELLGIKKNCALSLQERRSIVMAQYGMSFLYTLLALKEMLTSAVGTDNYLAECRYGVYQLLVKIINQDLQLVKEMYNMIALMRPAHIELLLYAEYREKVKIEIKQAVSIRFRFTFYPRFNLPRLRLDGTWRLDGTQQLSGYDGYGVIDLYPVRIRIRSGVRASPEEAARIGIRQEAREQIKTKSGVSFKNQVSARPESSERIRIRAEASHHVAVGVTIHNESYLDGTWKLDGSRKLNGGVETR